MNLIGFVQALLINISVIAGMNDPQYKVSPVGFLKMLLENNATASVKNIPDILSGQDREVKIRYMQRGLESDVTDVDDCETPITAEWKETIIKHPLFSKIGIFISDEEMRKYEQEATQTIAGGTPSVPLMRGLYETLIVKINGLIQKIDSNLVSAQAANFGGNAAYVSEGINPTIAQSIKLGKTAELNDGYVKLLLDAQANEINDNLLICGNGIVNAFDAYNRLKIGTDMNGIGALGFNTYNDPKTTALWGANHFGMFAKGTIGFVDWNKNVGAYAGLKGGSYFFTLPVPVQLANGELSALTLDCQLKYEDCPIYSDGRKVADRGWKFIISKSYGLFNMPTDAYGSTDALKGVNGSFHYVATAE